MDLPSTSKRSIQSSKLETKLVTNCEEIERRLWVGNLDAKLTEFQLLKMVQRYGSIEHFDYLFHRSGPNCGLPRGYAFVTFNDRKSAERCLKLLNGKRIMDKELSVRWANQAIQTAQDAEEDKIKKKIPALGIVKEEDNEKSHPNKNKVMSAIEAKLRSMERDNKTAFKLSESAPPSNVCSEGPRFQYYHQTPQIPNDTKSAIRTVDQRHSRINKKRYVKKGPSGR